MSGTTFFAPYLDARRTELGEISGSVTRAGNSGELLAQLSDQVTAIIRLNGTTARPVDADSMSEDAEPSEYLGASCR